MPGQATLLPYIAGLFDGEGTVGIYAKNRRGCLAPVFTLVASIANTDRPMLDFLLGTFGYGTIQTLGRSTEANKRRRPGWKWQVHSQQALRFLDAVYPFLRTKQNQAWQAMFFQRSIEPTGLPLDDAEVEFRANLAFEMEALRANSALAPVWRELGVAVDGSVPWLPA